MTVFLLVFCLWLSVGQSHICAIFPPQRGALSFGDAGDDSCFRRVPECGGLPAETPRTTLHLGTNTVKFQQNLNHWFSGLPGVLDVSVSLDPSRVREEDFEILATLQDYPAHEQVTQTNFSVQITLKKPSQHAVLRFRYVSNNPDEVYPANNTRSIFWQCADVVIAGSSSNVEKSKVVERTQEKKMARGCCAPPRFHVQGTEVNEAGVKTAHEIWWDATSLLSRWDKKSSTVLRLYNNYTNGNEFVLDTGAAKCSLFGNDAFYGWCYGSRAGSWMTYVGTENGVTTWASSNGFMFGSTVSNCFPAFLRRPGSTNITFFNASVAHDPSVFVPPSLCHSAQKQFISAILVAFAVFVHGSPVDHIVAFNFLPSVTPDQIDTVTERYLSLKDLCVDPATNQTYIVEFSGGRPNSREGFQQGMRLVFRMTLPNEYFRDYFVGRPITTPFDPFHDKFKQFVGPLLNTTNGVIVLDFTHGAF